MKSETMKRATKTKAELAAEQIARKDICACGHSRIAHCYGCAGDTLKGAVWHPCKCKTFKLHHVAVEGESDPLKRNSHWFGRHCQSREGVVQK